MVKEQKQEKVEFKEIKDANKEKVEVKEGKEFKAEKNELKDQKVEKVETKEGKLEKVEIKEIREKQFVQEGKLDDGINVKRVGREIDFGGFNDIIRGGGPQAGGGLDARLAALESSVAALAHFIGADLRPDLSGGALTREPDLMGQATAAKGHKDLKDKENLAEG